MYKTGDFAHSTLVATCLVLSSFESSLKSTDYKVSIKRQLTKYLCVSIYHKNEFSCAKKINELINT